ncbi:restriction endonuclease subunit S [Enterococcus sp. AZ192]|uniref:restriction endonuclease subunit S n=1 Tax=Enterococcus sp. AZ192 TaxID=2774648 RepID=UPI003D293700
MVRGASPRPIQDPKWFDTESDVGWLRIADVTEQDGRIHYLEQNISKLGQEKTRVLTEPHLLLSIAGTVGKPVVNYVKTGVHDGFLIFLNPIFERECMFQWLEAFRPKWQKYGQPGSQVNLNSELVRNQEIALPNNKEQQKIGAFFQKLDNTITLHQRKLETLKQMKKGFLQQMFPVNDGKVPRVRFAHFEEEWEQRNIKVISKVFIGLVTSMTENYRNEGTLLIRNSDIKSGKFEFADNPIYLDEAFAERNASRRLELGDVVTVHTGDIGTSTVIGERERGAIGFATINTRPNQDVLNSDYLSTYFNTTKHKEWAIKMSTGDGRSNYNLYDFNRLMIPLPNLEEQQKIGTFFKQLDSTITFHQQKLEQLKTLKKSYLQNMFI